MTELQVEAVVAVQNRLRLAVNQFGHSEQSCMIFAFFAVDAKCLLVDVES